MPWQKTLARSVNFTGIGLHQGQPVSMTIHPASANHGLRFVRTDLPHRPRHQDFLHLFFHKPSQPFQISNPYAKFFTI